MTSCRPARENHFRRPGKPWKSKVRTEKNMERSLCMASRGMYGKLTVGLQRYSGPMLERPPAFSGILFNVIEDLACAALLYQSAATNFCRPHRLVRVRWPLHSIQATTVHPQPAGSPSLSYAARHSVKTEYDSKNDALTKKARTILKTPKFEFKSDFDGLGQGLKGSKDVRDD